MEFRAWLENNEPDLKYLLGPTEALPQTVAQIGGPPDYVEKNWGRLVGAAQRLAELKADSPS